MDYNDTLREYYEKPIIELMNQAPIHFSGPYTYVPPVWHKRIRNRIKWKLRHVRESVGFKIAGYTPSEWDD